MGLCVCVKKKMLWLMRLEDLGGLNFLSEFTVENTQLASSCNTVNINMLPMYCHRLPGFKKMIQTNVITALHHSL
jgi:hypothetical protein